MGAQYVLALLPLLCATQNLQWSASNFPNPTANEYRRCKMQSSAKICDPDEILSQKDRYRLNHELHQLESRTRQINAPDFCQKKGITAAMAVMRHAGDGSKQAIKDLANQILKKWTLDDQCQKSVVFVIATDDRQFWVARDPKVPVYADEFTEIFNNQKQLFQQGNYQEALGNAVKSTWQKAVAKQKDGDVADSSDYGDGEPDRGKPVFPSGPEDRGRKGSGGSGGLLKMIPAWIWIALILVVVPIVCCCCCICYCCFCRGGRDGSARRQEPSDPGSGVAANGRGRGSGGGGMNSFLGGLGGAGVGQLLGSLLRGRGGGRGGFRRGEREPQQGQGGFPAGLADRDKPQWTGGGRGQGSAGRGLYPTAAVQDEGGGGGW